MAQNRIDNFNITAPKHVDNRYTATGSTPWASVSAAHAGITYKVKGLSVLIDKDGTPTEYWYRDGITESDLIEKKEMSIPYTIEELRLLNTSTNAMYTSKDGGTWIDMGLNDGQYEDNYGTIVITANGHALLRQFSSPVDVKWFGAIGDGSESLSAFQATVEAVPSGGTIYVPSGSYTLSNTLVINKPLVIKCEGSAFAASTSVAPTSSFPNGVPLIHFTNPLGRCAVYNMCSFMNRKGGDWITFDGDVSNVEIEGCHVRHVSSGHWGLNFDSPSAVNGAFLLQIINNLFYDFDGGAIRADKGGDSCNILRNCFQLLNSTSYLLYWDGKVGTSHLNFSENNATGASKFIFLNGVMQAKITKNQLEATTPIDNSDVAMIVIGGDLASDEAIGYDISDNNLNGHDGNALTAIHLKGCRDTHIKNNGIFGVTNSVKSTSLTRAATFLPGFTEGVINDVFNEISVIHGSAESVLQGDFRLSGKNTSGLTFGATGDTTSFLNVDLASFLTTADGRIRFHRKTNTTGAKTIEIYTGDGTGTQQHEINPTGNTLLNLNTGGVQIGCNDGIGKLEIAGGPLIQRVQVDPDLSAMKPYAVATYVDDFGIVVVRTNGAVWTTMHPSYRDVAENITAIKTFIGGRPIQITGNYLSWTASSREYWAGIIADGSGDFGIYDATRDVVIFRVDKTTGNIVFDGNVSGDAATASNHFITKGQLDAITPLSIKDFGARGEVGFDNTTSINSAIAAANTLASGKTKVSVTLLFPITPTGYEISAPLTTIQANVNVVMEGELIYTGASVSAPILRIGQGGKNNYAKLDLAVINSSIATWSNPNFVGIRIENSVYSDITIRRVNGFSTGVQIVGDETGGYSTGFVHNNIKLFALTDNRISIHAITAGSQGFVTENVFTGGSFIMSSGISALSNVTRIGVFLEGINSEINNNVFIKPSFELGNDGLTGAAEAIPFLMHTARANTVISARMEGLQLFADDFPPYLFAKETDGSSHNKYEVGFSDNLNAISNVDGDKTSTITTLSFINGTEVVTDSLKVLLDVAGEVDAVFISNGNAGGFTGARINRSSIARYALWKYATNNAVDWNVGLPYNAAAGLPRMSDAYVIATDIGSDTAKFAVLKNGGIVGTKLPSTEISGIPTPVEGEEVFDTTTHKKNIFNGTSWDSLVTNTQLDAKKAAASADTTSAIATADATDAATTQSLVNELKATVNTLTAELHDLKSKMRSAGLLS